MSKNRFKDNNPPIDFDDPAALTAIPVPAPQHEPVVEVTVKEEVKQDNPLKGMIDKKKGAKGYTYYLDDDVAQAVEKLAKQNKISRSKVVNMLLKDILMK